MGRKKNTVIFERELLKSKSYKSISAGAIHVYSHFMMKRKMNKIGHSGKARWAQINNGELVFTYSEAERELGMPRSTFMNCLDRLIEVGLIDIAHSGSGGKKGDVSLYAISQRWRKYGTNEFIEKQRPRDNRSGRGFAANPQHRKNRSKK